MNQVMERHATLASDFEAFRTSPAFGPEWLRTARSSAFARFLERGFPTTKEEEWKFTPVGPIASVDWGRADKMSSEVIFNKATSELTVSSLTDALATQSLDTPSLKSDHPFVLLNTAFFDDGVFIHVAPNAVITEPIEIRFAAHPASEPRMVTPRILVVVGEQAQVSVIERYESPDGEILTNAVTEFVLGPGAVVNHVKVQQEGASVCHMASTFVHLHRASTFTSQAITFGGR
jgi:Fe-S cluster assembly protein SufD